MTNLTEKWKAGELEVGWYYILNQINTIRIEQANVWIGRYEKPFVGFDDDSGIKEVLAPVPSYEELQSLEADRLAKNEGEEIVSELEEENARLKELLKECKELIKRSFDDYPDSAIYRAINLAIGEREE